MPIPKKPNELREMMREALLSEIQFYVRPDKSAEATERSLDAVMSTLAQYDPCLAKAAEAGEPTFTLRAQDKIAPASLMDWAAWAKGYDVHANKLGAVRRIAHAMRAWPNRRIPD